MVPFKDVEKALTVWLAETFFDPSDVGTWLHVGTELPDAGSKLSLVARDPFVLVQIAGGADNFFTDQPTVRIEVFGRTRTTTYDLSEAIRMRLLAAPLVAGGVVIDSAATRMRPAQLPWEGDKVRRRGATYELSVRRR